MLLKTTKIMRLMMLMEIRKRVSSYDANVWKAIYLVILLRCIKIRF